jgi:hypothetical protein
MKYSSRNCVLHSVFIYHSRAGIRAVYSRFDYKPVSNSKRIAYSYIPSRYFSTNKIVGSDSSSWHVI